MIRHSRPTIDSADKAAVAAVLESGHLVQGSETARFESLMASFIGVRGAVAVSSGTAGLHLSLLALKIGKEDEVIIPSYVCSALLHAVRYVAATPVVADIHPETYAIDPGDLKKRITPRTRAIILPHMFGLPAGLDEILALGIPVIEDCAQSIGGRYKGRCTGGFGTLSVFSFYATKMIATGEGGMVLSDREDLLEIVRDLRDYDEKKTDRIRFNDKMTDMEAAMGISQLAKLPAFIERRKAIARLYSGAVKERGIPTPAAPEDRDHIFYRYVLRTQRLPEFLEAMNEKGIECRRPVFHPLHRYLGLKGYPETEKAWREAVSIPIYPSLADGDIQRTMDAMKDLL